MEESIKNKLRTQHWISALPRNQTDHVHSMPDDAKAVTQCLPSILLKTDQPLSTPTSPSNQGWNMIIPYKFNDDGSIAHSLHFLMSLSCKYFASVFASCLQLKQQGQIWILLTLKPISTISFRSSSGMIGFNCSSSLIGWVAAFLPQPLGVDPDNQFLMCSLSPWWKRNLFKCGINARQLEIGRSDKCYILRVVRIMEAVPW